MWSLEFGPFDQSIFRNLPEKHWTLLVQAVNLWVPEVKKLADQFYFLPPWRLDDIMVSYAPKGGSVGPHFDRRRTNKSEDSRLNSSLDVSWGPS